VLRRTSNNAVFRILIVDSKVLYSASSGKNLRGKSKTMLLNFNRQTPKKSEVLAGRRVKWSPFEGINVQRRKRRLISSEYCEPSSQCGPRDGDLVPEGGLEPPT
jgi:hypothetical protein